MKGFDKMSINECYFKLKELNNNILTIQIKLSSIIQDLKEIHKIKNSFIIYTDFNKNVDEEYDSYLKYFESTVKSLTSAVDEYNNYYLLNYEKLGYCKNLTLKDNDYIYDFIKMNIIND